MRVAAKWRPPLILVVWGSLAAVLATCLVGVVAFPVLISELGWPGAALLVAVSILVSVAILGALLARLLLRPVHALGARVDAARRGVPIGRAPLPHYGTRELGAMGEAVLDMAVRLDDRATELAAYSAHVTHELRSPLTSLRAAAEMLEDPDLDTATRTRLAATVTQATARMERLLGALRDLAQAGERGRAGAGGGEDTGPSDLAHAARQAANRLEIDVAAPDRIQVPLPSSVAQAVMDHLAQNSAQHGATRISLTLVEGGVLVGDDGPGISSGNAGRLFEPFFTTRREGGGTGMGLAITARLLAAHGGDITFVPSDSGAQFRLTFQGVTA
ncbi:MAG: HAMP domain-containing sensor histidine kinase [Pseudomonadota bacterium]